MFERFTEGARRVVTGAQEQARALGTPFIGTEHLLLSLLDGDDATAQALAGHGVEAAGIRERITRKGEESLDPEALRTLGIDLDAVREATEEVFGEGALDVPAGRRHRASKGHIPFTPRAKKSLELSLRHAIRLKSKEIRSGHLLLGLLHDEEFMSVRLLTEAGVDVTALRADIDRLLTAEAA
ncbi:hypothetical protein E1293_35095 [Actinomadura darangshiensis]|uniref:Clp R domain-containing protein n=1 Tax=Actinomadura darangshiensis TaxID=705336 RepID=A0A4R5AGS7_9ACTN|nr:Clp protease N-terminal domain-containing protein [Actinomadura darangshiensis]TDD70134.1 hypothetical protein E1293_35095 [Actinomadura darangshiensis]